MSKISQHQFTCPHCKRAGEFTKYDSINVSLDPSLRDKLFNNELFDWKCPHCGETMTIIYSCLYHDMDHDFMVYFAPNDCEATNKQVNEMLDNLKGMRNCLYRTTDDLRRFKEKVLVLENGLNDIAIEFAKVIIKYSKDNNISEDADLYFEKLLSIGEDKKDRVLIFRVITEGCDKAPIALIKKEDYEKYLDAVLTSDKYKMVKYCDTIDENWIISRIK